jgi:hypothetical protein
VGEAMVAILGCRNGEFTSKSCRIWALPRKFIGIALLNEENEIPSGKHTKSY